MQKQEHANDVHGDPAMEPPPVILDPGPEYDPDTRPFQGIPGIERVPGGRLWAAWYGGGRRREDVVGSDARR